MAEVKKEEKKEVEKKEEDYMATKFKGHPILNKPKAAR